MSSRPAEDPQLPATLVQTLRQSLADERGAERAYVRFVARHVARKRSRALDLALAFAAGMLVSIGSLYAASAAPWHWLRIAVGGAPQQPEKSQRSSSLGSNAPAHVTPEPVVAVPAIEPSPAPSVAPSPPHVSTPSAAAAASAAARESWLRAASGLRDRDFDSANDALLKLSQQGTSAERDAARLVRAQLLLTQGKTSEARELLLSLQSVAASAQTRRKAGELLADSEKSRASRRSFEAPPGTNSP